MAIYGSILWFYTLIIYQTKMTAPPAGSILCVLVSKEETAWHWGETWGSGLVHFFGVKQLTLMNRQDNTIEKSSYSSSTVDFGSL